MTLPLEPPEKNALRCAELINQFWAKKGVHANAMVCPIRQENGKVTWDIRSRLVNGMSPHATQWHGAEVAK